MPCRQRIFVAQLRNFYLVWVVFESFNDIIYKWILKYYIYNNIAYMNSLLTTQGSSLFLKLAICYTSIEKTILNLDLSKFWGKITMLIWKSEMKIITGLSDLQKQESLVLSLPWQLNSIAYNSRSLY